MKSKSKGLGDTIAKVTKATGVEKIVKTFSVTIVAAISAGKD